MYTQFFQLKQAPFSIAPDPRYLFMSERHREALAHLLYGIGSGGGFVLLTGEIGAGKTTVCRCFLEQIPANCRVAYIFNPKLTVNELLQAICEEFRIELPRGAALTPKDYFDALNAWLLQMHAQGMNNLLIIDEAQNLEADVLEQLRLLTNLETNERKLLQIILIGQPELRTMLARRELEQVGQRVIARYHLDALSSAETASYIDHRWAVAGGIGMTPFPRSLMPRIHRLTRGVPRKINLLCDRALLGAYAGNARDVSRSIIDQAAREVFGDQAARQRFRSWQLAGAGALATCLLGGAIAWAMHTRPYGEPELLPANAAGTSIRLSHQLSDKRESGLSSLLPSIAGFGTSSTDNLAELSRKSAALQTIAYANDTAPDLTGRFTPAMRDEQASFRLLGQLWGIAIKQDDACRTVQSRNILCYKSAGGVSELRKLDRPAVLTLYDEKHTAYRALLIGLDQNGATLRLPGAVRPVRVSLLGLNKHFKGEFQTFWRAPPNYRRKIMPGDRGEDVDWLAAQLSKLNGEAQNLSGQAYNRAMADMIRDLQAAHGLRADGVAGPQTLMLVNNAAGVDEPHLFAGAGG